MNIDEMNTQNNKKTVTHGQQFTSFLKENFSVIINKLNNIEKLVQMNKKDINVSVNRTDNNIDISRDLSSFTSLNVTSYIPDISGKQIYKMNKLGWNMNSICSISGYSSEEAKKKYDQYVRNNV